MNPAILKKLLASSFVLVGGVAMVVWIWPDGQINLLSEVFQAAIAIFGLCTSVAVVWSLWWKGE